MEKEITKPGPVLDAQGVPQPGYSTKSILQYERRAIKAPPWRIKEWDFYQISDHEKCLQFTIGHASYAGQIGVMLFDFFKGERILEKNKFLVLPFNRLHMPADAEQDGRLAYSKNGMEMSFQTWGDRRLLLCHWNDFEAELVLTRQTPHALVINVPFVENPHAFYYNHKINCMTAEGFARCGGEEYRFSPQNSYGLLDWGRGVWPFHNEWYWSSGAGMIGGKMFGFNLGCGFGNTETATENILFYGDTVTKLGNVVFEPQENYMLPWRIHDSEGKLELTLLPSYDRTTATKLLWVNNCCHQVFGTFSGRVVLDDGQELKISNILSFAEHAVNNW